MIISDKALAKMNYRRLVEMWEAAGQTLLWNQKSFAVGGGLALQASQHSELLLRKRLLRSMPQTFHAWNRLMAVVEIIRLLRKRTCYSGGRLDGITMPLT